MKKLALLLILTFVLAFSFAFATDTVANPEVISGEVVSSEVVTNGENTTTDDESIVSGDTSVSEDATENVSGEVTEDEHDHDQTISSKSTVWGAVLAVVIVIIVVAFVALFSKKD